MDRKNLDRKDDALHQHGLIDQAGRAPREGLLKRKPRKQTAREVEHEGVIGRSETHLQHHGEHEGENRELRERRKHRPHHTQRRADVPAPDLTPHERPDDPTGTPHRARHCCRVRHSCGLLATGTTASARARPFAASAASAGGRRATAASKKPIARRGRPP